MLSSSGSPLSAAQTLPLPPDLIAPDSPKGEDSDRFLILDVSRYKYPPGWVETDALFAAMDTPDSDNDNKSRGFVIVSR